MFGSCTFGGRAVATFSGITLMTIGKPEVSFNTVKLLLKLK